MHVAGERDEVDGLAAGAGLPGDLAHDELALVLVAVPGVVVDREAAPLAEVRRLEGGVQHGVAPDLPDGVVVRHAVEEPLALVGAEHGPVGVVDLAGRRRRGVALAEGVLRRGRPVEPLVGQQDLGEVAELEAAVDGEAVVEPVGLGVVVDADREVLDERFDALDVQLPHPLGVVAVRVRRRVRVAALVVPPAVVHDLVVVPRHQEGVARQGVLEELVAPVDPVEVPEVSEGVGDVVARGELDVAAGPGAAPAVLVDEVAEVEEVVGVLPGDVAEGAEVAVEVVVAGGTGERQPVGVGVRVGERPEAADPGGVAVVDEPVEVEAVGGEFAGQIDAQRVVVGRREFAGRDAEVAGVRPREVGVGVRRRAVGRRRDLEADVAVALDGARGDPRPDDGTRRRRAAAGHGLREGRLARAVDVEEVGVPVRGFRVGVVGRGARREQRRQRAHRRSRSGRLEDRPPGGRRRPASSGGAVGHQRHV